MKKGFTLIELLAVIVILAIIAVIAVPIVLNIIDETKDNAGLRSAEMYIKAVELSIAQSTLKDVNITDGTYNLIKGNICLGEISNNECDGKILEVEVTGKVPESGTITITNGVISDLSIVLNEKTIIKNAAGNLVFFNPVCSIDRKNTSKYSIGDLVTCGEEEFYIMENEDEDTTPGIDMLTKYNLDLETNKQSETAGNILFSSSWYWLDNEKNLLPKYGTTYPAFVYESNVVNGVEQNLIYSHVISYENYLKELGVSSASTTLMSYETTVKFGCDESIGNCSSNNINGGPSSNPAPEWFYSTNYWTGAVYNYFYEYVYTGPTTGHYAEFVYMWVISSSGAFDPVPNDANEYAGIRPIVTISETELIN